MPSFEKARVGDRVFSGTGGVCDAKGQNATIVSIDPQHHYPISVEYDRGSRDVFTFAGGIYTRQVAMPSLFWSKPEWTDPPPPKRRVKKTLWLNYYGSDCIRVYTNESEADRKADRNDPSFQRIVAEVEVEEE